MHEIRRQKVNSNKKHCLKSSIHSRSTIIFVCCYYMELISECAVVLRGSHEQVNIRWVCVKYFVQFIISRSVGSVVSAFFRKTRTSHTNDPQIRWDNLIELFLCIHVLFGWKYCVLTSQGFRLRRFHETCLYIWNLCTVQQFCISANWINFDKIMSMKPWSSG